MTACKGKSCELKVKCIRYKKFECQPECCKDIFAEPPQSDPYKCLLYRPCGLIRTGRER